jgi:hypothetical protein
LLADEFLYRQNEFLIVGLLLALLMTATEIGFRRGRAVRSAVEDPAKSHYWTLQAGVMGLLALLLAFTFSMSVTRYETRRITLIDEVNAIGTAYLRSRLLPEPFRSEVAKLIVEYVGNRLHDYGMILDRQEIQAANLDGKRLQNQLWLP